jgi:hypothetical protein
MIFSSFSNFGIAVFVKLYSRSLRKSPFTPFLSKGGCTMRKSLSLVEKEETEEILVGPLLLFTKDFLSQFYVSIEVLIDFVGGKHGGKTLRQLRWVGQNIDPVRHTALRANRFLSGCR